MHDDDDDDDDTLIKRGRVAPHVLVALGGWSRAVEQRDENVAIAQPVESG